MLDQIEHKIIRSRRKTYSLSIDSKGELVLKVPLNLKNSEIDNILNRHSEWIKSKLHRRNELNLKHNVESLINFNEVMLLGVRRKIILDGKSKDAQLLDDKIIFNSTFETKLDTFIILWLKNYAKYYFSKRTEELANTAGLKFSKVKLSNARKRWGSCSNKGNINLAWRLIMAKPSAIDSVILHELAHTVYMDHSVKFYNLLDSLDLYRKDSDKWLFENNYLLNLY